MDWRMAEYAERVELSSSFSAVLLRPTARVSSPAGLRRKTYPRSTRVSSSVVSISAVRISCTAPTSLRRRAALTNQLSLARSASVPERLLEVVQRCAERGAGGGGFRDREERTLQEAEANLVAGSEQVARDANPVNKTFSSGGDELQALTRWFQMNLGVSPRDVRIWQRQIHLGRSPDRKRCSRGNSGLLPVEREEQGELVGSAVRHASMLNPAQ